MPRNYSPASRIPVIVSAAVTLSGNSGNLRTALSTVGTPVPLCDAVSLVLDVTAYTGTAGPNQVRIFLDTSPDGGTTWYPAITFALVTTSTDIQKWEGRTIGVGPNEAAALVREIVKEELAIDAPIKNVAHTDNRSYHINSDNIKRVLDFEPEFHVDDETVTGPHEATGDDILGAEVTGIDIDAVDDPL